MTNIDTFIASDVHLGSGVSRPDVLIETLKNYSFKRLILLGDIFDDLNFNQIKSSHRQLLSYIRELIDKKLGIEVVWIVGNHDEMTIGSMVPIVNIPVLVEYQWEFNGKKYLAIHGHQFDSFMMNNKFLSNLAGGFYKSLQKIDKKKHRLSRAIKRISKSWLRVSEEIATKALAYAKDKGVDYIFCGHTHQALFREQSNVKYFNTGCWTDIPSTYITIDESDVTIREDI